MAKMINENVMNQDEMMDEAAQTGLDSRLTDCKFCKHVFKNGVTCKAFPMMIPVVIIMGDIPHDREYPNDQGIHFEISDKYIKVGQLYRLK